MDASRQPWQETLNQIREFQTRRVGERLPLPEEVIREEREERDARLTDLS